MLPLIICHVPVLTASAAADLTRRLREKVDREDKLLAVPPLHSLNEFVLMM
jgi:hypothetical protein